MKKNTALLKRKNSFSRTQLLVIGGVVAIAGIYFVTKIFAASATLSLVTTAQTVNIGDTVTVAVRENSSTDLVNAVEADVTFDATKLQYVGASAAGSAFPMEVQKPQAGFTGTLVFVNGLQADATNPPSPVSGDQLVTTLTFKALAAGPVTLGLAAGSHVTRNSDNVDILAVRNGVTLNLADTAAPSVPGSLTAGASTLTSTTFSWSTSTDNVGVTGYEVYRNGSKLANSTATNYTDNGLTPGSSYTYRVLAVDGAGNKSAQSTSLIISTLADTQAPTAPGKPTSSVQTMTSITLGWTASTDNVAVTSYQVLRNGNVVGTPTTNAYTDNGLTMDTSYSYTVIAKDAAGNSSAATAATAVKTLADTEKPSTPQGVTGTVNAATQSIALSWTASTDNIGVTGYEVSRDGSVIGSSTTTSFNVTGAPTGTHIYTVVAKDRAGNASAPSTNLSLQLYLASDINRDGKVNVFDLSMLLTSWGATGTVAADVNGDKIVNIFDLSILLTKWTG